MTKAAATSVFRTEVLPFLMMFALLIAVAIAGDFLLHRLRLIWVGRYLGIVGALVILGSFVYSLRKRNIIRAGNPRKLLALHEFMAWFGSLLILIHAGIHFNAILPWLAVAGMLVNVISGLTGKFVLDRARRRIVAIRESLLESGMTAEQVEKELFWNALALDAMKRWRALHLPITLVFAVLAAGHMLAVFLFWNWR